MMDFFKGTVTRKDWMAVGCILGAAAVVVALFVFFVRAEQMQRLADLGSQVATAEQKLAEAQKIKANIDALREEMATVSKVVEEFETRLPNQSEMPELLQQFEGLAKQVGLDVDLATMDRIEDARKETIPYSVVARGNFHQIVSFINLLERYKRYLKVSDLSISPQENGIAEARFTLSTFSFRQAPAPRVAAVPKGGA